MNEARSRCKSLFDQAVECSPLTDVRFIFDDGNAHVCGHRSMLSCVSEVFAEMFRSSKGDAGTWEVQVQGVSRKAVRAFLEFVYGGVQQRSSVLFVCAIVLHRSDLEIRLSRGCDYDSEVLANDFLELHVSFLCSNAEQARSRVACADQQEGISVDENEILLSILL